MKGITNLLLMLSWCIDTWLDVQLSIEDDGKINFKDAPRFIDNITRIPGLIKTAPEVMHELLDLSGEEAEKVSALVIEKTGCTQLEVKAVISKAVIAAYHTSEWVKSGLELGQAIKDLKAANPKEV